MEENTFKIAGVDAEEIAEEYGTPVYVYDRRKILERFRSLKESISYPKTKIYYSCKANGNPEIVKLLREAGVDGIDAVSIEEAKLAIECGFRPYQISLTNPSLSNADLNEIRKIGIELKVDSISQLRRWNDLSSKFWIRINPSSGFGHHENVVTGGPKSKFGIYENEVDDITSQAWRVVGLHQHPGSDVLEVSEFMKPLEYLYEIAMKFPELEGINIGGGLGVAYRPDSDPLDIKELGRRLSESFLEFCVSYGRNLTLYLEPGRYFVAESGTLLTRVNAVKQSPERRFVIVDTGFNHLIRPVLYDAYHEVVNASRLEGEKEEVWIGGNVCESGDLFDKEKREITTAKEGDLLAIKNVGAYGYSMASNYTGVKLPAEVMVAEEDNHWRIRGRKSIDYRIKL